jgi:hypothetical protein
MAVACTPARGADVRGVAVAAALMGSVATASAAITPVTTIRRAIPSSRF